MSREFFSFPFETKANLTEQGLPFFIENIGMLKKAVSHEDITATAAEEVLGSFVIDYHSAMSEAGGR